MRGLRTSHAAASWGRGLPWRTVGGYGSEGCSAAHPSAPGGCAAYTLPRRAHVWPVIPGGRRVSGSARRRRGPVSSPWPRQRFPLAQGSRVRSEEHTSELQSRLHLVCRLLLEKKKKTKTSIE